jgi:hypothetical protein
MSLSEYKFDEPVFTYLKKVEVYQDKLLSERYNAVYNFMKQFVNKPIKSLIDIKKVSKKKLFKDSKFYKKAYKADYENIHEILDIDYDYDSFHSKSEEEVEILDIESFLKKILKEIGYKLIIDDENEKDVFYTIVKRKKN